MKTILFICCLCIITSLGAQPTIVGKTFKAKIGRICEEVVGNDTCAGKQIYMELYFEENQVNVIEVSVNSCGEATTEMIDSFPWHWKKNKHWTIVFGDLERTKNTIIENMRVSMPNGTLIGKKLNEKGTVEKEYRFCEGVSNYLNYEGC